MGRTYRSDAEEAREYIRNMKAGRSLAPVSVEIGDDEGDVMGLLFSGRSDTSAIDAGDARNGRDAFERWEL
jgi:hypothetical protein